MSITFLILVVSLTGTKINLLSAQFSGNCPENDPSCTDGPVTPAPCIPGTEGCPDGGLPCDPDAPWCKVDGGFTNWSEFSECSVTCGRGMQMRTRTCTNPSPKGNGKPCEGSYKETKECIANTSCPVDGGFTNWSGFGKCSKTCGTGIHKRTRTCTNPVPANGGRRCRGSVEHVKICNTQKCPVVDGGWSQWESFGPCSVSCNTGYRKRYRKCNNPPPNKGGQYCSGPSVLVGICNLHRCPIDGGWSKWGQYGACTRSCNGGFQRSFRMCNNPKPQYGGKKCAGTNERMKLCNAWSCPVV